MIRSLIVLSLLSSPAVAGSYDVAVMLSGATRAEDRFEVIDVDSGESEVILTLGSHSLVFAFYPTSIATHADGSVWGFATAQSNASVQYGRWEPVSQTWALELDILSFA